MTTLGSVAQVAISAGALVGGLVSSPVVLILVLVAVNLAAAAVCARRREVPV